MKQTDLLKPFLAGGTRNANFFNGRVLTAEVLQEEQRTNREQHWKLGRSIGEGIIEGLEVQLDRDSDPRTVVKVTAGQALNRQGQMLCLSQDVDVSIVPESERLAEEGGDFVACGPAGTVTPVGTGVYVLLMTPASGFEELAPRVGLADQGVARTCESKYLVDGVKFRLVQLDVNNATLMPAGLANRIRNLVASSSLNTTQTSRLRNLLAHWCLGSVEAEENYTDLYDALSAGPRVLNYGPLDKLRALNAASPNAISSCDIPLALIYWSETAISFVDMWSIRRRVHEAYQAGHALFATSDRRHAELEATLLQFQAQLSDLMPAGIQLLQLMQYRANELFAFLPAAGLIPERVGLATGFTHLEFFDGMTFREPYFIDGARLGAFMRMSFHYPPVRVPSGEFLWLYRVRQNRQPEINTGGAQAYMVFANGFMPFIGAAQFDLARWNYSNYGPGINDTISIGG